MKKILLSAAFSLLTLLSFAQNVNDDVEILRDMAAAERRALVAENLMLSEEESKIFWPMYDEYRGEVRKIGTARIEVVTKFADNYETMTDEIAKEIIDQYFTNEMNYNKVRTTYKNKMMKSLSPKLVFRFFQIENKIDAVIDFGMASEIPLIMKD